MTVYKTLFKVRATKISAFMEDIYNEKSPIPSDLTESTLFEPVIGSKEFEVKPLKNKMEMAEHIIKSLPRNKDNEVDDKYFEDKGLWAWLALALNKIVFGDKDGNFNAKKTKKPYFIPSDLNDYKTNYRHLIRTPVLVRYRFGKNSVHLLDSKINKSGEMIEQLLSRQEMWQDHIMELGRLLYFDEKQKKVKKDAAGKDKPGTARRFAAYLKQISVTFDTEVLGAKKLLSILPSEFDDFKPKSPKLKKA